MLKNLLIRNYGEERIMVIPVVYCCDNNFADVFLVSAKSLIENNQNNMLFIYLINNGISEEKIKKIKAMESEGVKVEILPFPDLGKYFSMMIKVDERHLSISTYGRLFISELLPSEIEKVLYLDCDIIVCKDLGELYSYHLDEKILGGIDDCKSKKYRWVLGLSDNANYINAGVLLIDLKRWRHEGCEKKLVDYIQAHNGIVHFEDQGAINAVLNSQIKILPLKFNVMTHLYDMSFNELMSFRKPVVQYNNDDIEEAKKNPIIIHYTSSFLTLGRVWNGNTNHKKKDIFWNYMDKAGIKDKTHFILNGRRRVMAIMRRYIPRRLYIKIAMIMHEYIEPIKYYRVMRDGK